MEEEFTPQVTFVGKTIEEYDLYAGQEDFYLKIKPVNMDGSPNLYFVIYEDAYGRCDGILMSDEDISKTYKIKLNK